MRNKLARAGTRVFTARMNLLTVFNTSNLAEAELVQSRLEASGLHPVLSHELAPFILDANAMTTGGISVQVPEEEAELAREVVALKDKPAPEEPGA